MNTVEEKQIDELAAYKGKWTCITLFKNRKPYVANNTWQTLEEIERCIALESPRYREMPDANFRFNWGTGPEFLAKGRDVITVFPIPVKS